VFLERLPKISVQRLFAVTLFIKIISSVAGLLLNEPVILGLVVPILAMLVYMVIGYYCREPEVSEDKFADSCYYIGFIFTITSIILSLFDLKNMGGVAGMDHIALRFGSAMVSTVLGMAVRVYLVSFRKDSSDAIKDAEDAVLDATRMLVSQLTSVMDSLKQFEVQVVDAAKFTVENVNSQIEALGTNYAQSLSGFYVKLADENKVAFAALIDEVRVATTRLADSVDTYSSGMKGNLGGIESKVTEFADAVTKRLANTTFPDDYFSRELKGPLDQLKNETTILGDSVRSVSTEVASSSGTLAEVLKQITSKTKKTGAAMDAVLALSEQHLIIVNNADLQLNSLIKLAERMEQIDAALKDSLLAIGSNSTVSSELLSKVASLSSESSALRFEIKDAMAALTTKLDDNATLATGVIQKFETHAGELRNSASEVIGKLAEHTDGSKEVANILSEVSTISKGISQQMQGISAANIEVISGARQATQSSSAATQLLNQATLTVSNVAESVGRTVTQVAGVADQIKEFDSVLRLQTGGILEAVEKLRLSHEAQPTDIANAVVEAMASRPVSHPASSILNGVSGTEVSNAGSTLISDQAPPLEPGKNS
jgi:archaellum component FlaC